MHRHTHFSKFPLSLWIKAGNNNLVQSGGNDKQQISTTLMQVIIIAAGFSQVSAAQLCAL